MADNKQVVISGTPALSLLGVAFIVLKLMGYITWSWWWVLAPFWVPFAVGAVVVVILSFVHGWTEAGK